MTPRRRPLAPTAVLLLALALTACGDDRGDDPTDARTSSSAAPSGASPDLGADDVTTGGGGNAEDPDDDRDDDGDDDRDDSSDVDDDTPPDGSSTISSDASQADFCGAMDEVIAASIAIRTETPTRAQWAAVQDAYAAWGEVGAPSSISQRELEGFEVTTRVIAGIDHAQASKLYTADDPDLPGLTKADEEKADDFSDYADDLCEDDDTDD